MAYTLTYDANYDTEGPPLDYTQTIDDLARLNDEVTVQLIVGEPEPEPGALRYFVSTPRRQAYEWGPDGLLKFYAMSEGTTWWKIGTEWFSGNYLEDEIPGADVIYRGGYDYEVTETAADELEALGFTVRTEPV